jgi:predicted CoA-binding protein
LFSNPGPSEIKALLERTRRVAVVGLSPKPHRDSNRIARYLLERGYDVIPVYPREDEILGQKVHRRVQDIPGGVDLVDVFRRSEQLGAVTEDAIAAKAPALWFQFECVDEAAAQRAQQAGLSVVMDRCIMVDHAALLGRSWKAT